MGIYLLWFLPTRKSNWIHEGSNPSMPTKILKFVEYTKHNPLFVYVYLPSLNSVYSTIYLDAYSNCTINIRKLNTVLKHLVFKPSSYNGNTLVL